MTTKSKKDLKQPLLIAGVILILLGANTFLSAQIVQGQPSITVTGNGIVSVKPDTAVIKLAVETSAQEAAAAAARNATLMNSVTQAVQKAGIKTEDTATRGYNVFRDTRYNSKTGNYEEKGYKVVNTLTVTVHDIQKTGTIIDAALKAGANQLSEVSFYTKDTSEAYKQARTKAVLQAKEAAQTLSAAAGQKIGAVLSIEELSGIPIYRNTVNYDVSMLKSSGQEATPITPGDTEVSVTVKVVFELK
ncbi:SIMPL domain-containing protein [Treponema lecithinolyticum]|uniref:SIMPL domain-containing protein n=1 Tax=Treponema lecithinolyticum TaxID=53418 RepID=UPI0028E3896C|nr:SIMPL domain-containing protein [Treponema lecithinolyticum]